MSETRATDTTPPPAADALTAAIDNAAEKLAQMDASERGRRDWSVYWPAYRRGRERGLSPAEIFQTLLHTPASGLREQDARRFSETMRGRWRREQIKARAAQEIAGTKGGHQ